MNARTTVLRSVAGLGLLLLGATAANAEGSTDIYQTNFQQVYADNHRAQAPTTAAPALGSTDIYTTNFQRAFPASPEPAQMADGLRGSTDIYATDFQKTYM